MTGPATLKPAARGVRRLNRLPALLGGGAAVLIVSVAADTILQAYE